jgi:gliding motility-associated-like protein
MGRSCLTLLLILLFCGIFQGSALPPGSPHSPLVTTPIVAVSSYFNANDPRDEWTELLVTADNTDMRNWTMGDNNAAQTTFQPAITFNNINLWNNLRAGTVIIIWHRSVSSLGVVYPVESDKSDGYIEVSANDPNFFSGGVFGTNPLYNGNTLNVAGGGDLIELMNGATFIHALGHKAGVGTSWGALPASPKLNYAGSLVNGEAVFVCPGSILDEYGTTTPQDGTTWTSKASGAGITFGLPNNCAASATANSDFWRSLRQPAWNAPVLTGTVSASNTSVTLNWNAATDPNAGDGSQGYIILRNTTNTFTNPVDGHTYAVGDILGGATVLTVLSNSQTVTYNDNSPVPCATGFFYRIYAFRYIADNVHGNDYDPARGRAYNETNFGSAQVTLPAAVAPTSAASDRDNFCADDPFNISLSASGGIGTVINWYADNCGALYIGSGAGPNNGITIPSPTVTTTYYARWENSCGPSACVSVTVNVLPNLAVSVAIAASENPVCQGLPVTFTATPANPGSSPVYQWKVNGANVGTSSDTYTYTPADGDDVMVELTSNAPCSSGSPASSAHIIMSVSNIVPVTATVTASPGSTVCAGTAVTYSATPGNGGTTPVYEWHLNGTIVGGNSPTYSNTPVDGDAVYCVVTSSSSCASGNPATSNTVTITISTMVPVSATVSANPGNVICAGTTVIYTALPFNGGTTPVYEWFLNNNPVGTNSSTYSNTPVNGDVIYCKVTSSSSCATGNPATSNTVTITITTPQPVGVSIVADPGVNICSGTAVTFTATPVNAGTSPTYQWYLNGIAVGGNNPVYSNTPADGDAISCTLTSNSTCITNNPATSNILTIINTTAMQASVTVTADHPSVCPGTTVTFTADPQNGGSSASYEWLVNGVMSQQGSSAVFTSSSLSGGEAVICRMTSSLTCVTANPVESLPVTLPAGSTPVIKLSDQDYLCVGKPETLDAGSGFSAYQWQDNSSDRYFTASKEGLYWVIVTNASGCKGSDSVRMQVCEAAINIPNAFSPNGDLLNDVFKVVTTQENITAFSMMIFSRWGEEVFESHDIDSGWDGKVKGLTAPGDVYPWKITYRIGSDGKETVLHGTVTLIQ